ncbi:MAG: hybrid sensor histidine kinase/response regulator [Acidobacteria bacterium]|nr:MAG: hybrid sensor histidine kinase/response regulator [Acidobacteriota bacterium]
MRSAWQRYGAALALALAAFGLKLLLEGRLSPGSPVLLLPLGALLAAWYGGLGPGLLATALSAVLAGLYFLDPSDTPREHEVQVVLAVLQGSVISLVVHLLRRALRQAEEARSHAAAVDRERVHTIENISDSYLAVDGDWRLVYANRSFLERYGHGQLENVLGLSLWEIYPELAGTELEERYRRAMAERTPDIFEMSSYLSDRWFRVVVEPTEDGLAIAATDLSHLKRTEEELRAAKEEAERARAEAEAANRMKDQFLATLSHELRGPVHAIAGWTQILRSGGLDAAKRARALDVIERNARAQAQLIGDLLDISRISSGKLRLETRPVYPVESVEAALAAMLPAAEAKGVRVERSLDADAGPVLADPDRLQQIVVNLLGNAVKFTPRGGWVEVRLEADGGGVRIQVRDSGEGIDPEVLPHVFDSFWQADASTTRQQGGLGLGLAIVRQLVELHGGSVAAASPGKGQGAVFTVSLPLLRPREATKELPIFVPPAAAAPSPPLAGLRVLAVEDDESTLDALTELLSLQGADVAPAASVSQALETLEGFAPDVLVSDIGMPERDGYDLIREIRALGHDATNLPAVAVTAFASPEDRQRALAAGFQVHLAKPVDPRELTSVIASLAGR